MKIQYIAISVAALSFCQWNFAKAESHPEMKTQEESNSVKCEGAKLTTENNESEEAANSVDADVTDLANKLLLLMNSEAHSVPCRA
jgi:hypothetical protein